MVWERRVLSGRGQGMVWDGLGEEGIQSRCAHT